MRVGMWERDNTGGVRGALMEKALHRRICRYYLNCGIYRVIQEERPIFWEVTVSVIVRKNFIRTCV
jgi:hypothetical protein